MATTSAILIFGHVLLTSAPDLVAWGLVSLCVLRAELREEPRWWLVAGALAGLATYNKLLVAVLLAGIASASRRSARAVGCCRRTSGAAPASPCSSGCRTSSTS